MFSEINSASVGVVIRNSDVLVLASQTQRLQQAFSPEVTEIFAAHREATLALELGFFKVVVEGNSQALM